MSRFLYLNGAIVPADEARISPLDRGFLFGDGLFETMRAYGGAIHLLRRHLDRLGEGADALRISLPSREVLIEALRGTLTANEASDAVLRLTVSRGPGPALRPTSDAQPTILVTLRPLLQPRESNAELKKKDAADDASSIGSSAVVPLQAGSPLQAVVPPQVGSPTQAGSPSQTGGPLQASSPPQVGVTPQALITLRTPHVRPVTEVAVKSISYLPSVLGSIELERSGEAEGIMLTHDGMVAEGTVSNLFCVVGGVLRTPPLELGILPGVTRERVLELARAAGLETNEAPFDLPIMKDASECFYTNSVRELVPIASIDGDAVGSGAVGPITSRLLELYRRETPDEDL